MGEWRDKLIHSRLVPRASMKLAQAHEPKGQALSVLTGQPIPQERVAPNTSLLDIAPIPTSPHEAAMMVAEIAPGSGEYIAAGDTLRHGRAAEQAFMEGRYSDALKSMGLGTIASLGVIPGIGAAGRLVKTVTKLPKRNRILRGGTAIPWKYGRVPMPEVPRLQGSLYRGLAKRQKKYWKDQGIDFSVLEDANAERYAELVAQEVEAAHRAGAWGAKADDTYMNVDRATAITARLHGWDELLTDHQAEQGWKMALAITSNGVRPNNNYPMAVKAYEFYRKNGRWPEDIGAGMRASQMKQHFARLNEVEDLFKYRGEDLYKFFNSKFTAKQLREAGFSANQYLVGEEIYGSGMFGPKLGNEYAAALMGDPNAVTKDLWFMNSYKRLTGNYQASASPTRKQNVWFEKAYDMAQKKLARRNIRLDKAMIQAIHWGHEQDVARSMGKRLPATEDYAAVAARHAKRRGWTDEQVEEAIAAATSPTQALRGKNLQAMDDKAARRFLEEEVPRLSEAGQGESVYGIHWSEKLRDVLEGPTDPGQVMPYSREVSTRMAGGTKKYPYVPTTDFYAGGTTKEQVVFARIPHAVKFMLDDLYDLSKDPLGIQAKVAKAKAGEPFAEHGNIMAKFLRRRGYKGIIVDQGDRSVIRTWAKQKAEPPIKVTTDHSNVVESLEAVEQNLQALQIKGDRDKVNELANINKLIRTKYDAVEMDFATTSLAKFGGATSGQMENGFTIQFKGPVASVRSLLAETAKRNRQHTAIMRYDSSIRDADGVTYSFRIRDELDLGTLDKELKRLNFGDFKIIENPDGTHSIDQFVLFGDDHDEVLRMFEKIGEGELETVFQRSEVLGDVEWTGDLLKAREGYKQVTGGYLRSGRKAKRGPD